MGVRYTVHTYGVWRYYFPTPQCCAYLLRCLRIVIRVAQVQSETVFQNTLTEGVVRLFPLASRQPPYFPVGR